MLLNHYDTKFELQAIEQEDQLRKKLISLAILKVITISQPPTPQNNNINPNDNIEELTKKCHNYEIIINKLKQEWTTKEKVSESKIEKMKDDINKLKQQIKDNTSNPTQNYNQTSLNSKRINNRNDFNSNRRLTFATSPYLSRIMTSNSKGSSSNYLSPTANSINKSIFAPDKRGSNILSPIQQRQITKPKPTITRGKYNTFKLFGANLKKQTDEQQISDNPQSTPHKHSTPHQQQYQQLKPAQLQLGKATASRASPGKSPGKTPSRLSFVENFDNSDSPKSPSPEFTPTKRAPYGKLFDENKDQFSLDEVLNNSLSGINDDKDIDANSTSIMESGSPSRRVSSSTPSKPTKPDNPSGTDDEFASANSTIVHKSSSQTSVNPSSDDPPKKKTKKLNLSGGIQRGLNIDQDGTNILSYYGDDNFQTDDSPNSKLKQTATRQFSDNSTNSSGKKLRTVFKIT